MPRYIRPKTPAATWFVTACLAERGSSTLTDHARAFGAALAETRAERPFEIEALVLLPDHLHMVLSLPTGDRDISTRIGAMKARFTRAVRASGRVGWNPTLRSASKVRKGDAGLWQRRFWDHAIRNSADFEAHIRYCWGNPVRHGLVERAADWPFSTLHRDIRLGRVEPEWEGRVQECNFGGWGRVWCRAVRVGSKPTQNSLSL